jgi:Protein of unknown function (DUF2695)
MTLILTPSDPRWRTFVTALGSDVLRHRCKHDHRLAEQILGEMGDIDVSGSVAFFRAHGGFCDCEILFNVEDSATNQEKH